LTFQGRAAEIQNGEQLEAGRTMGWLAPGNSTLRWDVKLA
jgi:hypothetical protein